MYPEVLVVFFATNATAWSAHPDNGKILCTHLVDVLAEVMYTYPTFVRMKKIPEFTESNYWMLLYFLIATKKPGYKICLNLKLKGLQNFEWFYRIFPQIFY